MKSQDSGRVAEEGSIPQVSETFWHCLADGLVLVDAQDRLQSITEGGQAFLQAALPSHHPLSNPPEVKSLPHPVPLMVQQIRARPTGSLTQTLFLQANPKSQLAYRVRVLPLPSRADASSELLLQAQNLSPLLQFEEYVRRLDRLASIGTLSTGMAHEIKNAMQPVTTLIDTLIDQADAQNLLTGEDEQKLKSMASDEIRRIRALVNQMLSFASPAKPSWKPLRMHELIDKTLFLVSRRIEARQIVIRKDYEAPEDEIMGNGYQLEQALFNIFLNAMDALNPGGQMIVHSSNPPAPEASDRQTRVLRVTVSDNGIGIAPDNLTRLFDTFFTTKQEGTGLGLSITRRIMQEHDGDIRIDSKPQQGTTVTLDFPLSPPHSSGQEKRPAA